MAGQFEIQYDNGKALKYSWTDLVDPYIVLNFATGEFSMTMLPRETEQSSDEFVEIGHTDQEVITTRCLGDSIMTSWKEQ